VARTLLSAQTAMGPLWPRQKTVAAGNCFLASGNVLPLDFLPLDGEDVSQINDNMYWHSGQLILAAARFARINPNLHLIYISNFKCGPDSGVGAPLSSFSRSRR
jgi:hypothetical protein